MIKKTTFLCGLLLAATSILSAQTQQGYVRTLERPDNVSVALEGVTVQVRGGHNAVVSGQDGLFRLPMDGKRNGDSYTLQQVQKKGFELADQGTLGRRYAYSDKVPLTVVMVSTRQLQADKQRIANNAYQTAERTYKQQLDILEKQLSDSTISEETYRTKLQELQQNLEHYQSLVEDLSDHYARTDYALLDKKEREVNLCIERGELEKADSLLATMFNPQGVLERNREALAEADRRLSEGQTLMEQAQSDLAAVLRQQEKDAEYLYQLYTIALDRFDNEKARYYIETRAALDTINIDWQVDAALFLCNYVSDFPVAMSYGDRAVRQARLQYGEMSTQIAESYTSVGFVWESMGQYSQALTQFERALHILQTGDTPVDSDEIAALYGIISQVYSSLHDWVKAVELNQKAIEMFEEKYGEYHEYVAARYVGQAHLCTMVGAPHWSIELNEKALRIYDSLQIKLDDGAAIYNNMGMAYCSMGNYDKAFQYCSEALSSNKKRLGVNHPRCADIMFNLGVIRKNEGKYDEAMNYLQQALIIYKDIYGGIHQNMEQLYDQMGQVCNSNKDYEHALEYVSMALFVGNELNEDRNHDKGYYLRSLASIHMKRKEFELARKYFMEAFDSYKGKYPEGHIMYGMLYYEMGILSEKEANYETALDYFFRYYNLLKQDTTLSLPDKENKLETCCAAIYLTYPKCDKPSRQTNQSYEEFIDETAIVITVMGPETPAGKKGLEGDYLLLAYNEWNLYSKLYIGEYNATLGGKPKDLLLMRDNGVQQYHFEDKMGVKFNLKYIGKEEKEKMKVAYKSYNMKK